MKTFLSLIVVITLVLSVTNIPIFAEEIKYEEITNTYTFAEEEKTEEDNLQKEKYVKIIDTYVYNDDKDIIAEKREEPKDEISKGKILSSNQCCGIGTGFVNRLEEVHHSLGAPTYLCSKVQQFTYKCCNYCGTVWSKSFIPLKGCGTTHW